MSSEDRRDPNRDRNRIVRDPPGERPMPDQRGINPTAAGGPATPAIPGTGGAQDYAGAAGGGPHAGAQEGGVTGVLGMGSGAVGRPSGGMGDDRQAEEAADDDDVSADDEDRAGGIISERNVALFGTPPTAREAEALYRASHHDAATEGKATADHAKRRP